ncbi:MAG: hypothetical protein CME70_24415 [Halobacteriovorax sp.]|nr:hypothetical protein [Halobacteriovorax sp.]
MTLSCFQVSNASIDIDSAKELSHLIVNEFSNDLKVKDLIIEVEFKDDLSLPSAYANWKVKKKVGLIKISNKLLKLNSLDRKSFASIICHEIGHFLGGTPYVRVKKGTGIFSFANNYPNMSAEGQADFFSTSVCLPRIVKFLTKESLPTIDLCHPDDSTCNLSLNSIIQVLEVYKEILNTVDIDTSPIDIFNLTTYPTAVMIDKPGEYPSMPCRAKTLIEGYYLSRGDNSPRPDCWYHED